MQLNHKVRRSKAVIKYAERRSPKPLIVNFSGGKDSLVLLDLVQRVTDRFLCMYCVTGIEFPEAVEAAKRTAEKRGIDLYFSHPRDHKGGFFERISVRRSFPTVITTWCGIDLKWRPQKKLLRAIFGHYTFYKLNAVRREESSRRQTIYKGRTYLVRDFDSTEDFMVFPILDWTTKERDQYLEKRGIKNETDPLYERYGVSGCYWCPFYGSDIYLRILKDNINLYDRFIGWERILNAPSVIGHTWLRDLKKEVTENG